MWMITIFANYYERITKNSSVLLFWNLSDQDNCSPDKPYITCTFDCDKKLSMMQEFILKKEKEDSE